MLKITDLPLLNASLNTFSAILLIMGKRAQSTGRINAHKKIMSAALFTSTLFLTSYLIYHFQSHIITKWEVDGALRWFYYTMLFTHIVLAILIVPGIIQGVWMIIQGRIEDHQKTMKIVWPAWLYVSITGVLVYLFLYQLQPWLLSVS
ncbi:MAG: DUF420 domain-containing protein [Oligoflexales bacterium]